MIYFQLAMANAMELSQSQGNNSPVTIRTRALSSKDALQMIREFEDSASSEMPFRPKGIYLNVLIFKTNKYIFQNLIIVLNLMLASLFYRR